MKLSHAQADRELQRPHQKHAREVIELESRAVAALATRIDHHFDQACELILACKGRVVVVGMGKSGHIGGKIASTLASTGTPAFFVHPGEASHGDIGMITPHDIVIGISNSVRNPGNVDHSADCETNECSADRIVR